MKFTQCISSSLVLSISLIGGCAIRGDAKGLAYAVDGVAIVSGAALMGTSGSCKRELDDITGLEQSVCVGASIGAIVFGTALILAGSIGLLTNIVINAGSSDDVLPPVLLVPVPAPGQPQPVSPPQTGVLQPVPAAQPGGLQPVPAPGQPQPVSPPQTGVVQPVPAPPAQPVPPV